MKILRNFFPSILWMVVIFVLSSTQRLAVSDKGMVNFLFFKTLHVLEYGLLFTLYLRGFRLSMPKSRAVNVFLVAFALTVLYALTDEFHQTKVPTREGKFRDVIIDATGAGLAWYFLVQILPKAPKKLRNQAKRWGVT